MLKILIGIAAFLGVAICVYFAILGYKSKSGSPPGMTATGLRPCPDKPNCVCSEFPEDASHYTEPLAYENVSHEQAWQHLRLAIEASGGEVMTADHSYLAATYSVSIFGFIDDVECRLDTTAQRIHIRSASRMGHSDLGVNKKRVEKITEVFKGKSTVSPEADNSRHKQTASRNRNIGE